MKKFGLIGYPLGHSFSRNFFNEKFQSENIDAEYVNFEFPTIEDFPQVIVSNPTLEGPERGTHADIHAAVTACHDKGDFTFRVFAAFLPFFKHFHQSA